MQTSVVDLKTLWMNFSGSMFMSSSLVVSVDRSSVTLTFIFAVFIVARIRCLCFVVNTVWIICCCSNVICRLYHNLKFV